MSNRVRVIVAGTISKQKILWEGDESQLVDWLDGHTVWMVCAGGFEKRVVPIACVDVAVVSAAVLRTIGGSATGRPFGLHADNRKLTSRGQPSAVASDR